MKAGFVYLMAKKRNGTTYLGCTSNLQQRAYQHRNAELDGFSKDKECHLLVWYEHFNDLQDAKAMEARMKKWKRPWKLALIEKHNPQWKDLYDDLSK
jgi:putative endonuclease